MGLESDRDFEIRLLSNRKEADECADIMRGSEPWETFGTNYSAVPDKIMEPNRETHLAVKDNHVIGFIIIRMDGGFIGYISLLAVHPDWRGKGVGTGLIRFAEERIFAEAPNVFICVSSFNPKARALYNRLGYEEIGPIREYAVRGHDEILLRKTIGPLTEFRR